MVDSEDTADAIRRRMARLRRELTSDVRGVREGAKEMANPMHYIRRYPWLTAAVVAGVGYMLVPKKKHLIQPDADTLAEMLKKHQIKLDPAKVEADNKGMLKSLAVMGLTWAVRTGLTYFGDQLVQAAKQGHSSAAATVRTPDTPEAAPMEQPWNSTG